MRSDTLAPAPAPSADPSDAGAGGCSEHCPHCTTPLTAPLGPQGARCPDCRLYIGPCRTITADEAATRRIRRDRA